MYQFLFVLICYALDLPSVRSPFPSMVLSGTIYTIIYWRCNGCTYLVFNVLILFVHVSILLSISKYAIYSASLCLLLCFIVLDLQLFINVTVTCTSCCSKCTFWWLCYCPILLSFLSQVAMVIVLITISIFFVLFISLINNSYS